MGLGTSHLGQDSLFILYLDTSQLNKTVPLVVGSLGWFFCLLGCRSFPFVACFSLLFFWVLWLICGWQGFIKQFLPCYKTLPEDVWQEISRKVLGYLFLMEFMGCYEYTNPNDEPF
jgi:hypothetical protein